MLLIITEKSHWSIWNCHSRVKLCVGPIVYNVNTSWSPPRITLEITGRYGRNLPTCIIHDVQNAYPAIRHQQRQRHDTQVTSNKLMALHDVIHIIAYAKWSSNVFNNDKCIFYKIQVFNSDTDTHIMIHI